MTFDPAAAGRAMDFIGALAAGLVTLHADLVLGFILGAAALRRYSRGSWDDIAYVGFLAGLTAVLLLGVVFLGLRIDVPDQVLFLLGLAAAALAWILSGGLPPAVRRTLARTVSAGWRALSISVGGLSRPRVPDRLPAEIRSLAPRPRPRE